MPFLLFIFCYACFYKKFLSDVTIRLVICNYRKRKPCCIRKKGAISKNGESEKKGFSYEKNFYSVVSNLLHDESLCLSKCRYEASTRRDFCDRRTETSKSNRRQTSK